MSRCVIVKNGKPKMRPYEEIVESWVREFYATMDEDPEVGDNSGDTPNGVKIIYDGCAEDDDGYPDRNSLSFAVFVHKDSLTKEFPEHNLTPWCLIHRPKEEVCIYVWYDCFEDKIEVIPFEESYGSDSTELDYDFVYKLINDIWERDK